MRYRILGPLEVRSGDDVVALGGIKPRAVLAVLLLHPNEPVSAERLAIALWGDDAADGAVNTVRVHVSRLRKALGDGDAITTTPAGYRLRVHPAELDAAEFERLVEDGRRALASGQPQRAATVLREALTLWRGPALAELAFEPFARVEVNRLEEQRLSAIEARIEADLAIGQHAELIAELQQLAAAHATRERLAGQLMLALYRCGRQSDALEAYHETRRVLVAEIGVEPGPELRDLQQAILRQEATLEVDRVVPELPPQLDRAPAGALVGREDESAWLRLRWDRAREGSGGVVVIVGLPGSGKSRLAAELAASAHRQRDAVLYTSGREPVDAVTGVLDGLPEVARPTLLVFDDADAADPDALSTLQLSTRSIADRPLLVLVCCEDPAALEGVRADDMVTLGPLPATAVRTIGEQYAAGRAADEIPVERLLRASGGLPGRIHEAAGHWARGEAARRVAAAAERAGAERTLLRTSQDELVGGVVELQEARERILPRRAGEPAIVCPFKGLASYDVADADYFFGRERLVAELVARLVGAPLLAVVGPSGSGKSSVLRAGLLPALSAGVLPGSERWAQALMRPGPHPLRALATALTGADAASRIVLAVDQFEETFTVCQDTAERTDFISELVHATQDPRYVVILALRADYYGRCAVHPALSALLAANNVLVGAMRRDELRRAVEGPCDRAGLRVEPDLVVALVDDFDRAPGGLPVLSAALLELWQRRDGRRLRHSIYVQTGGVRGAVARLAEDAFGELDEPQKAAAEAVLMRLVDPGEGDAVERRRVALDELESDRDEDTARVVALLTDRRLLTVDAGSIEIAHEALLREWPRLQGWIERNREWLRVQRALREAARDWDRLDRDDGALLRGPRLAEALECSDARGTSLNELERAFVTASDAARRHERVTRRRRMALAFGSLAVALLTISVVAAVSIVDGRRTASRELANRSAALLAGDPALALALGLQALGRSDTDEARNAVRQATLADRSVSVTRAHESAIYRAALSPDNRRLATAGDDGTVRVVSLGEARVVSTIKGSAAPLTDVSVSPDATHVASASVAGDVVISNLDGSSRHVVLRLAGDPFYARSVDYEARGRRLLVAVHGDDSIRVVDIGTSQVHTLATHAGIRVARFEPHGRGFVSAGEDGDARLWDAAGQPKATLRHGSDIFDARFSPDGRYVATAGADGALRVWSAGSGRLLHELALDLQPMYSVRFSRDGRRLVAGGADGVVRVIGVGGGPLLAELKGHRDRVYDAGFLAADGTVYSAGTDGTVRTWSLPKITASPADPKDPPTAPSLSPDGKLVVSGYVSGRVRLWNPRTASSTAIPAHTAYSVAMYSANGAYILSLSNDRTARLYDVKRRTSSRIPVSDSDKNAMAIDSAGRRIAFAGLAGLGQGTVIQGRDGRGRVNVPVHGQAVWLSFSPDAKHLVSASDDGTVRVWNATTGASEHVLKAGEGGMLQAQFSPDGRRVAAAGADGTVRVWDLDGGEPLVFYGHEGPVTSVGFSAAGTLIVSGGKDGTVRVWDAAGGAMRVVLSRYDAAVTAVAFGPDNQVLSATDDGIVVAACEVCGPFADVLALARTRPQVKLGAAERARLGAG